MRLSHIPGVAALVQRMDRGLVVRSSQTHFLTNDGPLCGVKPPFCWCLTDDEATCWTCRALLAAGGRDRRPVAMQTVVTIGRIRPRE